jgi:hypothetical protein
MRNCSVCSWHIYYYIINHINLSFLFWKTKKSFAFALNMIAFLTSRFVHVQLRGFFLIAQHRMKQEITQFRICQSSGNNNNKE